MSRILLLGANGFLGKHLCHFLSEKDFELKTLSRKGGNIDYKIDMGNAGDWDKIDFKPEIVINCATVLPGPDITDERYAKSIFHTNFWGAYNLCTWVNKTNSVKYILNISSLSVINKPWPIPLKEDAPTYPLGQHAIYCLSKLNQEIILNSFPFSHDVKIAHARLSALFGEQMPWNGIICTIIDKVLNNENISLTNGDKVSADYLYVKDACRHILELIRSKFEGIINVASGEEIFLIDLAQKILNLTGGGLSQIINIDRSEEYNRAVIDIGKLRALELNFYNTDFLVALKETINYRKEFSYA